VFVVVIRHILSRFLSVRYSIRSRGQVLVGSSTVLASGSGSVGGSARSLLVRVVV
jgi:hypothetical protein